MADEETAEATETASTENEAPNGAANDTSSQEEEFDKDRALATIRKQRESEAAAVKRAKDLEAKVREFEDRDKSEQERLTEARDQAATDAASARAEATRLRMAIKYGLDEEDLDLLGEGDEEKIEARAKRLSERSAPKDESKRRPREDLRAGAVPGVEPDVEPGLARLQRAYAQQ